MTDNKVMEEIERVVTEVEAEILANSNRTWTIEIDHNSGEHYTLCPWCGAKDEINEHDVGIRWNRILPDSKTTATATVSDDADFEMDGWVCASCGTDALDAPDGFEITSWY